MSWCIESKQFTAVNAGIYGLSVSMGDQFSTDYSAMVGPILIISTAHLMKFQFWCIAETLQHICGHLYAKKRITAYFGLNVVPFFRAIVFLFFKLAGIDQQY